MDTSNSASPPRLTDLFDGSQQLYEELEKLEGKDPKYIQTVQTLLNNFQLMGRVIESRAIFSSNEEIDDINSHELKYVGNLQKV
jgi:hypothetical protein